MTEHPTPEKENVLSVVEKIYDGKILLPEFQRSFVWGNQDIKDLLVSVLSGYFIGTLLFLRRNDVFDFAIRYFEGVVETNNRLPLLADEKTVDKIVLDGQQRLTALYYVIHNPKDIHPKGAAYPYRYFLRIFDRINGKSWDECILALSEGDSKKDIAIDVGKGTKSSFKELLEKFGRFDDLLNRSDFKNYCFDAGLIPCNVLGKRQDLDSWLEDYGEYLSQKHETYEKIKDRKKSVKLELENWFSFTVPVLLLENKNLVEVAEIFERINRTGVELSVFALATAVFFKQKNNLRDWWIASYSSADNDIKKFCKIEDENYAKYVLQIMALLQDKEVGKKILINPKVFQVSKEKWDEAFDLLNNALKRLQDTKSGYGVIKPNLLPYEPLIVTLAALLKSTNYNIHYRKLDAWYWSSVFTERYAGASETAIKQDYDQVKEWFSSDKKKPTSVIEAENKIDDLRLANVDRGAIYKSILNIVSLNGATDFFLDQSIQLMNLNDHHIFPKGCGLAVGNENSILNRTLIGDETNKKISKKKPSEYLKDMETKLGEKAKIKSVLESHILNEESIGALWADNYKKFLTTRESAIKKLMKSYITL